MVSRTIDSERNLRFVIRPNRSLTWRQTKLAFLGLAIVCLTIAGGFASIGYWPVLPFAGAELAAVGAGMYACARAGRRIETVSVSGDLVAVEKGLVRPLERWEFPRGWAQIRLLPPVLRWYPSRLVIRSHGREIQLADFLNEDERRRLARELERAVRGDA